MVLARTPPLFLSRLAPWLRPRPISLLHFRLTSRLPSHPAQRHLSYRPTPAAHGQPPSVLSLPCTHDPPSSGDAHAASTGKAQPAAGPRTTGRAVRAPNIERLKHTHSLRSLMRPNASSIDPSRARRASVRALTCQERVSPRWIVVARAWGHGNMLPVRERRVSPSLHRFSFRCPRTVDDSDRDQPSVRLDPHGSKRLLSVLGLATRLSLPPLHQMTLPTH